MKGGGPVLNYIKAELYRAAHHMTVYLVSGILLALALAFALMWVGPFTFPNMAALLSVTMPIGLFMAAIMDVVVVSGVHRTGSLKNEVEFGIPRSRIYLGRLLAAFLLAVMLCILVMGGFLGLGWLFTAPGTPEETRVSLAILGYVAAASFPLWLGALGLTHALFLALKNEVVAACLTAYILLLGEPMTALLTMINSETIAAPARAVRSVLLTAPFGQYQDELTWQLMAKNWAIGLGWLLVSTVIGLWVFRRSEVK